MDAGLAVVDTRQVQKACMLSRVPLEERCKNALICVRGCGTCKQKLVDTSKDANTFAGRIDTLRLSRNMRALCSTECDGLVARITPRDLAIRSSVSRCDPDVVIVLGGRNQRGIHNRSMKRNQKNIMIKNRWRGEGRRGIAADVLEDI